MQKTLPKIREKIDAIDNQVHDLLMERAALVSSVALAKKETGAQIVQPAREAMMMRRLLGRHDGPLPRSTIIRIWRELVGSVALLQSGFTVTVCSENENSPFWDMSKDYFGSSVPMRAVQGVQNAISSLSSEKEAFAVMPWPELEEENPWWAHLFNHQDGEKVSIICALPYGIEKENDNNFFARALVISKVEFMDSENDVSIIGVNLTSNISRVRIMETAEKAGFDVMNLYSGLSSGDAQSKIHLLEVSGFLTVGDQKIQTLRDMFGEGCRYCDAVGGYPIIPDVTLDNAV